MERRRSHGPRHRGDRPDERAGARRPPTAGGRDGRRSSSGNATGALVRPTPDDRPGTGRGSHRSGPRAAQPSEPSTPRLRDRSVDDGVASLGEARARQRLRTARNEERRRRESPAPRRRPHPRQRARRTIRTTKPLLAQRFGAGRPRFRLISTLIVILLVFGAVLAKVGLLQGSGGDSLRVFGAEQWGRTRELPAQRGAIFDRNGDELALSVPAATVVVNPRQVDDPAGTAAVLAQLLTLDDDARAELAANIGQDAQDGRGFRYVARQIDPRVAAQIDALGMAGVSTYPEDRRMMPGGATGRSVIGRTDIDGVGTAGLELQYNDRLQGSPGEETLEVAPGGRSIAGTERLSVAPVPGMDVVTTIDRSVQYSAEQALLQRVNETGARGGQLIVMATDGDIIAMASVRRNDVGVPVVTSGNYSAVDAYEPGSVGKIITVSGALEDGVVTPDRSFTVPWQYDCTDDPTNGVLSDSHQHDVEQLSVHDIIVESSNVGTILMGKELTRPREDFFLRQFGLGEVTPLNFPGESPGILKPWQQWEGTERCTIAYGQGLASSPVQLAAAVNTIANGGVYAAPRLVSGFVGADGDLIDAPDTPTHYVVSPDTASQVASMLRDVVCSPNGTANAAQVPGLSVAGKTGTAYKARQDGTYRDAEGKALYYTSFVGFFPTEAPQVTVLVSIDEPPTGTSGGQAAAPVFGQIAPTIVNELGIQPPAGSTGCDG